jgi:DNA-directed RNA polymerase subunit L
VVAIPQETEGGYLWQCETKSELHSLVAKLNDVILNDAKLHDVRYGTDHSTVFSSGKKEVTMKPDMTKLTVSISIKNG